MRILFIGDIFGRAGREIIENNLPRLQTELKIDFTIANAENAAGGFGLNFNSYKSLYNIGIDAFTLGNHAWHNREIFKFIDQSPQIIRPANMGHASLPGSGYALFTVGQEQVLLINLIGRVFMDNGHCPFMALDNILKEVGNQTPYIFVDFHAEATSEKMALAWYADGRISALAGTHTHVQTNDQRILNKGTGYITDAGMTGPKDSILGVERDIIIDKFLGKLPRRFEPAHGDRQFNGVIFDLATNGRCQNIETLNFSEAAL